MKENEREKRGKWTLACCVYFNICLWFFTNEQRCPRKTEQALNPVRKYIWGGQGNIWLHQTIDYDQAMGGGVLTLLPGWFCFQMFNDDICVILLLGFFTSRRKQKKNNSKLPCICIKSWNIYRKLKNGSYTDAHLCVHMFVFYAHQKYNCICLYSGNPIIASFFFY